MTSELTPQIIGREAGLILYNLCGDNAGILKALDTVILRDGNFLTLILRKDNDSVSKVIPLQSLKFSLDDFSRLYIKELVLKFDICKMYLPWD